MFDPHSIYHHNINIYIYIICCISYIIYNVKARGWVCSTNTGIYSDTIFPNLPINSKFTQISLICLSIALCNHPSCKKNIWSFFIAKCVFLECCVHISSDFIIIHSMDCTEPGIFDLWRVHWSASPSVSPKQWVHKTFIEWVMKIYACYSRNKPCLVAGTFWALQCLKKGLGYCGIALEQWFNKSPQSHQPIYYNRIQFWGDDSSDIVLSSCY